MEDFLTSTGSQRNLPSNHIHPQHYLSGVIDSLLAIYGMNGDTIHSDIHLRQNFFNLQLLQKHILNYLSTQRNYCF